MRTMICRGLAPDKGPFRTVRREKFTTVEGVVKHAFGEADLMQVRLQRTKVKAYSVGSATHAEKCRTSTAAQPILPSRNSLLYQVNISRTSVKDQHKRGTPASCQLNIRGPSEEHQNIRRISEEHQSSISESGRLHMNISDVSANYQSHSQRHILNYA
jgi:hypothetical protein